MNHFIHPPFLEREVYILRIWYELDGSEVVWRASVLLPEGAQRRHFSTPDALVEFLNVRVRGPRTD